MEFLSDVALSDSPLIKYNTARLKVLERQEPKDMMVAEGDDTESEVEDHTEPQTTQPKKNEKSKKHETVHDDLEDDLVEDYEFSDQE